MMDAVERVDHEQEPETDHRIEVAVYRFSRHCGNYEVGYRGGKGRDEQPNSIVNLQAAERCTHGPGKKIGKNVADGIGQGSEGDSAQQIPASYIQPGTPALPEGQSELNN